MILRPCLHCVLKKECEKKKNILAQIKGLGLTTASFSCKVRFSSFPPGTRIEYEFDISTYEGENKINISGTVMYPDYKTGKLMVWLDEEASHGIVVRLWPDRVTILNEPQRKVCPECGKPDGEENAKDWFCPMCDKGLTWEQYNTKEYEGHF